jgi:hypothetical protein
MQSFRTLPSPPRFFSSVVLGYHDQFIMQKRYMYTVISLLGNSLIITRSLRGTNAEQIVICKSDEWTYL